jgi:hypothetical protein
MTEELEHGAPSPDGAGAAAPAPPPHRHRILIDTLFALATIIGVVAVLAVWANRQALNTNNWTNTSSQLLADKQIQTALAAFTVNELLSSGAVEAQLEARLPTQLQSLAGLISGGLQQLAGQAAPKLLASPQVQDAWRQANRAAHATFLKIIYGGGSLASTNGGVVTLNLHAIVPNLRRHWGFSSRSRQPSRSSNRTRPRSRGQQARSASRPRRTASS